MVILMALGMYVCLHVCMYDMYDIYIYITYVTSKSWNRSFRELDVHIVKSLYIMQPILKPRERQKLNDSDWITTWL